LSKVTGPAGSRNFELLRGLEGATIGAMAEVDRRARARNPQPRGEAFVRVVLEATLMQLAEVGFERLSIPEVAARAGVNKTSIYRRWPGKSELVRDALTAAMSHVDAAPDAEDLRQRLIELAKVVAEFVRSPLGTAVVRILLAEGANPEVRGLAIGAYRAVDRAIPRAALLRAVECGELAESVDPKLVLFTIAGAIVHRAFIEQAKITAGFIEDVVDLVLHGASRAGASRTRRARR
jgi:AcrR family transcriptional regulator